MVQMRKSVRIHVHALCVFLACSFALLVCMFALLVYSVKRLGSKWLLERSALLVLALNKSRMMP